LLKLHAAHAPKEEPARSNGHHPPRSAERTDEEIIGKARAEKNGKFDRLMRGDLSDYGGDHSDADDGFIHKVWSYTQDEDQVRRIHAASGLHRAEKSGKRPDYLRRSIERASKNVTWFYGWKEHARVALGKGNIHSAAPKGEVAAERKITFRTAREVAALTPAKTEWIARPWIAKGAITEIDGKIKAAGKTTLLSHIIRSVVSGSPFMGEDTTQTKVLLLTEQTPTSFRKVLERAGLTECDDLLVLFWHDVAGLEWPEVAALAADKAKEAGAELLVTDTLGQFAGIRGDGENNAGAAQEAMQPLQEAAARGLGVVLTRHERKGGGEVGESARGSSAFGGAVDVILSLRRGEGNVRPTVRAIESLSRFDETPDKLVVELTPSGYRSLGDATAFAEEEARQAILEVLPSASDNATTTGDLIDKLKEQNVKRTVAQSALAGLIQSGTVTRIGGGKKGDPYRHFLSAGRDGGFGGKQPHGAAVAKGTPNREDQIHSARTSTLYTAERKNEREELVL